MKTNSPGSSGGKGLLRQWASPSFDPNTGRSVSSVADQGGSAPLYGNYAKGSAQIPDKWARDHRATQGGPVHKRPFTQTTE